MKVPCFKVFSSFLLAAALMSPALAEDQDVIQAIKASSGNNGAEWSNDDSNPGKQKIRATSYGPIGQHGGTAGALVYVGPENKKSWDDLRPIEQISYDIYFFDQLHQNVKPELRLQYFWHAPNSKTLAGSDVLDFNWDAMQHSPVPGGRQSCKLDVSKVLADLAKKKKVDEVRVARFAIGGREIKRSGFNCFMDVELCNIQVWNGQKQYQFHNNLYCYTLPDNDVIINRLEGTPK